MLEFEVERLREDPLNLSVDEFSDSLVERLEFGDVAIGGRERGNGDKDCLEKWDESSECRHEEIAFLDVVNREE